MYKEKNEYFFEYEIIHWLTLVFPFFPPSVKVDLPKINEEKKVINKHCFVVLSF